MKLLIVVIFVLMPMVLLLSIVYVMMSLVVMLIIVMWKSVSGISHKPLMLWISADRITTLLFLYRISAKRTQKWTSSSVLMEMVIQQTVLTILVISISV